MERESVRETVTEIKACGTGLFGGLGKAAGLHAVFDRECTYKRCGPKHETQEEGQRAGQAHR